MRLAFTGSPFSSLEPDVLKRLGGASVEPRGTAVVAAARGEVALRDPRRGAMAGGAELREQVVCRADRVLGLVQATLLEQRPAQDELRATALVDPVLALPEQPERVAGL